MIQTMITVEIKKELTMESMKERCTSFCNDFFDAFMNLRLIISIWG